MNARSDFFVPSSRKPEILRSLRPAKALANLHSLSNFSATVSVSVPNFGLNFSSPTRLCLPKPHDVTQHPAAEQASEPPGHPSPQDKMAPAATPPTETQQPERRPAGKGQNTEKDDSDKRPPQFLCSSFKDA
jgi:hypothetical protein